MNDEGSIKCSWWLASTASTNEDHLNSSKTKTVRNVISALWIVPYAAEAARSSVFLGPVKIPNKMQNTTVNNAITPRRALVSCIELRMTIDKMGINDAIPIAKQVTIRKSGFREYNAIDAIQVPVMIR